MPYGIPASKGGESKENVRKMEACVKRVMTQHRNENGFKKSNAIAICKSALGFTKGKSHGSGWTDQYRGPGYMTVMKSWKTG